MALLLIITCIEESIILCLFLIILTDGGNLESIERNFSDWSDDSDDDILNQPGEPVRLCHDIVFGYD